MSAFMVSKDHIDAIVHVALYGPSGAEVGSRWGAPRWARHDPHTLAGPQEWRQCVPPHGHAAGSYVAITPDALGELLWIENERSIEDRYPSDHAEMLSIDYCLGYQYAYPRGAPALSCAAACAAAFKAITCLDYQSCEHNGWPDSEAHRFLTELRCCVCAVVPGYDRAQWEVSFDRAESSV